MPGNAFGQAFRFETWGESHGPAIGCVVDGVPPLIPLSESDLQGWLDRRRPGQSRFTTQRREPDTVKIISGVTDHPETGEASVGRGDKRTAKGKRFKHSFGNSRPKNVTTATKKKAPAAPAKKK